MQIAVVEDKKNEAEYLAKFLKKYADQYEQELNTLFYESGERFLKSLKKEKFHLVFMDIYMDQMDGIETARTLNQIDQECLIAFLTSSDEDIWRAVSMHSCFDYIRKEELNYKRIEKIIKDAEEKCKLFRKTLKFFSGKQEVKIPLVQIQGLESRNKNVIIYLKNGKEFAYRINFSVLYELLESQKQFLLCNRGVLLNMNYIEKADKETFLMENGQKFPIRRYDRLDIIKRYNEYQFEKLNEQEAVE